MATANLELDTRSAFGSRRASTWERLIWKICDWRVLPQAWRQKLRKRYARKIVGPFDVLQDGMKFRLYPAENHCDRVMFGRGELPELAEHEALIPLIKPGMVFVDIGANVGSYSAFVGNRAKGDLTLIAFEPHIRTYQKLLFNLQVNDLPVQQLVNAGAGENWEKRKLWSDGGSNIGHTSMLVEGTAKPVVSIEVSVVPLLDWVQECSVSKIDLLKIDIEGFEDRALAPFFDHAPEKLWPTNVLIEVAHQHLWKRDLMTMMIERGYREIFSTTENRLMSLDSAVL